MNKLIFDYIELISNNFYKVTFKPFLCDNFLSNILTSTIRQCLFINTPGFSITEISIEGLNNEYGNIEGMEEDVLNLILNLKGLIFKLKKKKIFLKISVKKKIITGFDIKNNKFFKILNPNHVICHSDGKNLINFRVKVEKGKGYVPFSLNKNRIKKWKNSVSLDASFCPILRVSYVINNLKNIFYENFKVFIFFIKTNGSINIKKAILNSLNLFSKFPNLKNDNKFFINNYFLSNNLFNLNFSFKILKILLGCGISKLDDLLKRNINNFFSFKNFNNDILIEIKNVLKNNNLFFF